MNKWLVVFCLIAGSVFAGPRYIYLWLNNDASANDKQVVKQKIKDSVLDQADIPDGAFANLPQWQLVANTNRVGRVLCLDRTKPNSPITPLSITKEQFDNWKAAHMENPNHLQSAAGDDDSVLRAAGLEPVPQPQETTP